MFRFLRNVFLLSIFAVSSAFAVGDSFDQARFEQLLKEGKPVLLTIHADWCSTCRTQDVFLEAMLKKSPYNKLNVLRVDFDKQIDVVRAFRTRWQSTLIVFKDGKEVERSTADTDEKSVAQMLRKAL